MSGSAFAADLLPTRKAPPAPAATTYSWTGFYLGAGVGFGMGNVKATAFGDPAGPAFATSGFNDGLSGPIGFVKGGYDYQFNKTFVVGVFGDFDVSRISGAFATGAYTARFNPLGGTAAETSSWALGGRVGWLLSPNVLTYETAGFTRAHFGGFGLNNLQTGFGAPFPGSISSSNYNGWFIGGGVEAALPFSSPGWFVDAEYRYSSYGSVRMPILNGGAVANIGPFLADMKLQPSTQTITASLVYKFGMTPVAGSYAAASVPDVKWTGFYLGAGAGHGMWNASTSAIAIPGGAPLSESSDNAGEGFLGLVKAGYDYQLNKTLVVGAFGEYDLADLSGSFSVQQANFYFDPLGGTEKVTSQWALGGRLGWLIDPALMAYGEGGYTQAQFAGINVKDLNTAAPPLGVGSPSHTYQGWFVGVGTEAQLSFLPRGWFVDTAYRYARYDGARLPLIDQATGTVYNASGFKAQPNVQSVTSSLVYKF